jgi:hypothetical protein
MSPMAAAEAARAIAMLEPNDGTADGNRIVGN